MFAEIMDDRRRAQEQRKKDSRQWQKKKDDLATGPPLFGPPVKVCVKVKFMLVHFLKSL